jgi:hypothetical protein
MFDIAIALYLSACPREQLVRIDRAHDIFVDPHVEALSKRASVSRLVDDENRQVVHPIE